MCLECEKRHQDYYTEISIPMRKRVHKKTFTRIALYLLERDAGVDYHKVRWFNRTYDAIIAPSEIVFALITTVDPRAALAPLTEPFEGVVSVALPDGAHCEYCDCSGMYGTGFCNCSYGWEAHSASEQCRKPGATIPPMNAPSHYN
jgi:hypothetical protein